MFTFSKLFNSPNTLTENEISIEKKLFFNYLEINTKLIEATKLYPEERYEDIIKTTKEIFNLCKSNEEIYTQKPSEGHKLKISELKSQNDFYYSKAIILNITAQTNYELNIYLTSNKAEMATRILDNALINISSLYMGKLEGILTTTNTRYQNKEYQSVLEIHTLISSYAQPSLQRAWDTLYAEGSTTPSEIFNGKYLLRHAIENDYTRILIYPTFLRQVV